MTSAPQKTLELAVASMVLGILGFILLGPFASIPAVICGHIAKSKFKQTPDQYTGEGMALAGLIMGYIQIAFFVLLIPLLIVIAVPALHQARSEAIEKECENNLRLLEATKMMVIMEKEYPVGEILSDEDMVEIYAVTTFSCPHGGEYMINPVGWPPSCSVHSSRQPIEVDFR
ncbi:DUF4190 domain-containing protein [Kiritimatiellota bacterium B12222]|nr:DUF4190 domain-containing protein [Kiritimatiellota bacterium B12222]